ncbi:hypothetical protein AB6H35_12325 [Citrobacter freundii]|uniref:hypothetical protein n=1 Tax=Citrobacter freundii TaxID=546 RepID=UPI0034DD0C0E
MALPDPAKVFESIRTKGAAGKQLAMGERSLLDAFQSAAVQISADGLDSLVRLAFLFCD